MDSKEEEYRKITRQRINITLLKNKSKKMKESKEEYEYYLQLRKDIKSS